MMSSYASLLSMSPAADWAGGTEFVDADDDTAAVSSYLSFDTDVGEEEWYPPPEAAAAAFRSEPQGRAPLLDADCCGGEASEQSRPDASVLRPAAGLANHDKASARTFSAAKYCRGSTSCGSARSLPRSKIGKIAFKTRSDVDVLDDGYRWRKYGKKMVKNSPNPRNYYRCSSEGCRVKKRVERERDDARFVITTYDGVHNHPAAPQPPSRVYRLGAASATITR